MGKIGILGCGWLGLAFAKKAVEKGYGVNATTTTPSKKQKLQPTQITPFFLKVNENEINGEDLFFNDVSTLIISIPPGLRKNANRNFDKIIGQVIAKIKGFKIKKVVFLSSTSVYGFQEEEINEESPTLGATTSAIQLLISEKMLLESEEFETCVIRMGGLIGPERHPVYSLSLKKNIPNPDSPVNFIHQRDAVDIIFKLIENWQPNEIYNAVTPFHPSRKNYYTEMASIANINPPDFLPEGTVRGKISSQKVRDEIDFTFLVDNLLILN
jgi:nucleoside-diphosphate-sugar epimerase